MQVMLSRRLCTVTSLALSLYLLMSDYSPYFLTNSAGLPLLSHMRYTVRRLYNGHGNFFSQVRGNQTNFIRVHGFVQQIDAGLA